ncbi:hypothetical protein Tco_1550897, partial [Tanacetum coccineum]
TARESSIAGIAGLVSMYRKNRDRHCAYRPVANIGGRSLEPAAIMLLCI